MFGLVRTGLRNAMKKDTRSSLRWENEVYRRGVYSFLNAWSHSLEHINPPGVDRTYYSSTYDTGVDYPVHI